MNIRSPHQRPVKYLRCIVDEHGRSIDFRLTAKRDAKAAQAFLNQARRQCGHNPLATFVTDKAPTYPAIIRAMGTHAYFNEPVQHINQKGHNNRMKSDHAALKRIVNPGKGVRGLRTAKPALLGIEAFRTIKRGDLLDPPENPKAELRLVYQMFGTAA